VLIPLSHAIRIAQYQLECIVLFAAKLQCACLLQQQCARVVMLLFDLQCDELKEDSESLVVMVALQHLRLVIANWRRAGYSKDLSSKIKTVQEEIEREEEEMEVEGEQGDTLDIAKTMIRSISLEREQRQRVEKGGTPRRKAQVQCSLRHTNMQSYQAP
jgi:hypothetical protein